MATKTKQCDHKAGYRIRDDGELACIQCGEPSPSAKWRQNIYGVNSDEVKARAKAAQEKE